MAFNIALAAPKTVLIETFSNRGSSPSSASQSALRATIADLQARGAAVQIDYHVGWPADDVLYFACRSEVETQLRRYGFDYVPALAMDGLRQQGAHEFDTYEAYVAHQGRLIDAQSLAGSSVRVSAAPSVNAGVCAVAIDVTGEADYASPLAAFGLLPRLHVALVGSDGNSTNAFLGFLSNPRGDVVEIAAGRSTQRTYMFSPDEVRTRTGGMPANGVVAWVDDGVSLAQNATFAPVAGPASPPSATEAAGLRLSVGSNPYRPSAGALAVYYYLPRQSDVSVCVYNAIGARVATLDAGERAAGVHQLVWDSRSRSGKPAPTGLYFFRLQAGTQGLSQKVFLIR